MAFVSLQDKLQTCAAAFIPFRTLLSITPQWPCWYDTQLPQGAPMGCIVVLEVSGPKLYSNTSRNPMTRYRMQFEIWGSSRDQCKAIQNGLACFLDQTSFTGISPVVIDGVAQAGNLIVSSRDGLQAQTQPPKYLTRVDAFIWNNDTLSI